MQHDSKPFSQVLVSNIAEPSKPMDDDVTVSAIA